VDPKIKNNLVEFNEFLEKKRDSEIAERAKEEILKHYKKFSPSKKLHLLSRFSSAYPEEGYSIEMQREIPNLQKILKQSIEDLKKIRSTSSLEGMDAYNSLCKIYFPLQRNNLLYLMDPEVSKESYELVKSHFIPIVESMIDSEEIILNSPATLPRTLYYGKSLGIIDEIKFDRLEGKMFSQMYKVFSEGKLKSPKVFDNYIYFLTHIILGDLNFYTSKILEPRPKMKRILDFFEKNSERIIKECAWDKIAEVGVCLKYCGRSPEKYKKAIREILNSRGIIGVGGPFKKKEELSPGEEIDKKEHSNVLCVLLFSDRN
jgi:hypothetical protein